MTTARRQKDVLLALGRYNPKMHRGVARFAGRHNWHINAEMAYFGQLPHGWKGDGIITLLDVQQEVIDFVRAARVPVVDLSVLRQDVPLPRVAGDHRLIGCLAAEHFLERGFRHFAWFSTMDDVVSRLRQAGFCQTLTQAGFACESWIFPRRSRARRNEWAGKCAFLERRLEGMPKPAAVFAFHDADAGNVLDACAAAALAVPEEVAILGADNNELICETARVPLSSVNHDLEGVGYEGAALLHRLMLGGRPPKLPRLIRPKGVTVRRSTNVLAINYEPARLALQSLQQNYQKRTAIEDAVTASGLSRRNLERAFRRHVGRSLTEQLSTLRLSRAKDFLLQTELSAADIAAQVGFTTPQYFSNTFHKTFGVTPRRFRLRHQIPNAD
jgi:LacI family transcriptional regulator